jgi:hypothetical protein
MGHLDPSRGTLTNRRRKPADGAAGMAALGALVRNPVALTIEDGGAALSISAERGVGSKVWLTCQCADSISNGWCRHRVDLLCFRYDQAPGATAQTRRAFEQIVSGTPVCAAGRDADRALSAFDECLRVFDDRRPVEVHGRSLGKFADLIADLAACTSELEDALGTLRRLLERA